jgi:hypothetical protein
MGSGSRGRNGRGSLQSRDENDGKATGEGGTVRPVSRRARRTTDTDRRSLAILLHVLPVSAHRDHNANDNGGQPGNRHFIVTMVDVSKWVAYQENSGRAACVALR